MDYVTLLVIVLILGLASQLIASRIRVPAIVVLITVGLIVGPITGLIEVPSNSDEVADFIGLGVALVLFEGALGLRVAQFKRVGHSVRRLVTLGPPIALVLGATTAHYVAGFSWTTAIVTGAILVVTGPTVIVPLLRQARMNKDTAALLKWEGIVNDPIGVMLAVLAFQFFTVLEGQHPGRAILAFLVILVIAAAVGGAAGLIVGKLFRSGIVPLHLKSPLLLVLVLTTYLLVNLIDTDAGLLTVTAMGLVIGNMNLPDREQFVSFNESVTVLVLSTLFILIPAQLTMAELQLVDWRILAFVAALMLVVRPVTIYVSTFKAPMRREDKTLLARFAPRGIVAAATAGVFGPALVEAGYADAAYILPTVFLVILVTVLVHGFTLGPLARKLGLAAKRANGLLIVGASPFTHDFARALHRHGVDVLVASASYRALQAIRMDEVPTYAGEVLSEEAESTLDIPHLNYVLSASNNDYYNALVSRAMGNEFGFHRAFQLATHEESEHESKRLTLQQRGSFAFDGALDSAALQDRLAGGWSVRTATVTPDYTWAQARARLDAEHAGWFMLAGVAADGTFTLASVDQKFQPATGWQVFYFAPGRTASKAVPAVTAGPRK